MKTSELFEKEIGFINNQTIKDIVRDTLDASPKCIQTIPASSSGKYYPKADLGDGGLVRHIKTVTAIAKCLINTEIFKKLVFSMDTLNRYGAIGWVFGNNMLEWYSDIAIASCILHDCCKASDDDPEHKTIFEHPIKAAELFNKIADKYKSENNEVLCAQKWISDCIKSHMGQWNVSRYSETILPKPEDSISEFVHMCDYLASRKFIDFNFDAYNEEWLLR